MENAKTTAKEQECSALLRAIADQPLLIRSLLKHKKELTEDFVQHFLTHSVKKVYFCAQASGTFVGNMLAPCMEQLLQVETEVCNPASFPAYFQFNINQLYKPDELLMLCPAHSGTTTGPIRMAQECKRLHIPVICTTVNSASPLAKLSDIVIGKCCGFEESFIETRTHMASLMIFFLCIIETTKQKKMLCEQDYTYYQQYFSRLADSIDRIIRDTADWYKDHRELLQTKMIARYIGAGPYYAVAQEGGLKIAEATAIASLVYVILIAEHSHPLKDSKALLCHFQNDPYCSVMEYMVPFQMLAYLLAKDRGLSVVHAANDGASAYLKTHTEEV